MHEPCHRLLVSGRGIRGRHGIRVRAVWYGERRARALGHRFQRPASRVSAVTRTGRTMIVSSSTLTASVTPVSVRSATGRVAKVLRALPRQE